jgi:mandelamide amidase
MKGDDLRAYLQAANSALQPEDVLAQIQAPAIANLFRKAARMPWPPGAQQAAYAEAQVLARRFEETLARAGAAALVFACEPVTAQKIKDPIDASPWIVNGNRITPQTLIRNSSVAAGLGLPAIAVPVGISSNGLPVGLELNTPTGQDLAALSLAGMVESIIGREPPPPSAA